MLSHGAAVDLAPAVYQVCMKLPAALGFVSAGLSVTVHDHVAVLQVNRPPPSY